MTTKSASKPDELTPRLKPFIIAAIVITIGFSLPLYQFISFSFNEELYSHVILIPFVSGYLIATRRTEFKYAPSGRPYWLALLPASLAGVALWIALSNPELPFIDHHAALSFAHVSLVIAAACIFLEKNVLRCIWLPLVFLYFMAPFPTFAINGLEAFFQYTSAEVSYWMLSAVGTPMYRASHMVFEFPTITLQVAPECSGIRSSLVLFITSIVAADMFLRSRWRKVALVFFVIPLGIVRNAFRVFVIAQLCVHVGPEMVDSAIHHKGGPIFFALSLPFMFLFMYLLLRNEKRQVSQNSKDSDPTD